MAFLRRDAKLPCSAACRADLVSIEAPVDAAHASGCAHERNFVYRSEMEDALAVGHVSGLAGWRLSVYGVFDGHGGAGASRWCGVHMPHLVAAHAAVLHAQSKAEGNGTPAFVRGLPGVLDSAFRDAEEMLSPANGIASGTTATVAVLAERADGRRWLVVANAGDSEALYAWPGAGGVAVLDNVDFALPASGLRNVPDLSPPSDGSLGTAASRSPAPEALPKPAPRALGSGFYLPLGAPHRGSDAIEVARVRACGGLVYDQRVNGVLAVTRSLGDHDIGACVSARPAVSVVEIHARPEAAGGASAWLLLACDGVFDVCEGRTVADALLSFSRAGSLDDAAHEIVRLALSAESTDNISALVVRIDYT